MSKTKVTNPHVIRDSWTYVQTKGVSIWLDVAEIVTWVTSTYSAANKNLPDSPIYIAYFPKLPDFW